MEVRKVQQVGYSTLIVSLPRSWAKEVGLKRGDVVSFNREEDGTLRLFPGIVPEEKKAVRLILDADRCSEKGLLSRIITGSYILGHDSTEITSKRELSQEHLAEIRSTVQRLNGIGIVEQSLRHVLLQCFIDPTKFPIDRLIRRLYVITTSMQSATTQGLSEMRKELASEAVRMEEEVDRIYWLGVRQLVLASRDKEIAKKIGIEHPEQVVGNRVILKALEKIGDLSEFMAKESFRLIQEGYVGEKSVLEKIFNFSQDVQRIQDMTIKALFSSDMKLASSVIELVEGAEREERDMLEKTLLSDIMASNPGKDPEVAFSSLVGLRGIVMSLGHIVRFCSTIAEIAINRTLEKPREICRIEVG